MPREVELIQRWREAAAATKEAQKLLDAAFEAFVHGDGPKPDPVLTENLKRLQVVERERLEVAYRYVQARREGEPSGPGALS